MLKTTSFLLSKERAEYCRLAVEVREVYRELVPSEQDVFSLGVTSTIDQTQKMKTLRLRPG